MEYQHWLREAISQLQASESPRRDAEILLEHVTGRGRTFILAFGETQLTDEQCQQLDALLTRRRDGEPIAHLSGRGIKVAGETNNGNDQNSRTPVK